MPRFAANLTVLFAEAPFLQRFPAAARAGFKAVECLFPYEHAAQGLKVQLEDNQLEQVLFNTPPGDWEAGEMGLAALPGRQAEFRASLDLALRYAEVLDCRQIHCMAGRPPDDAQPEVVAETYRDNLAYAATQAEREGRILLIEPINTLAHPGYYLSGLDQAAEIVRAIDSPALRLQFDFHHAHMMGENLARQFERCLSLIHHVQISGAPERHEPDEVQEIDYQPLFDLMDRLEYRGWVGCEYRPRRDTHSGLAWAKPYGIACD